MWWIYALLSALFAALTAIFAKVGMQNVNSNLGTAIRTIVVLVMIWLIVFFRNEAKDIGNLSRNTWFSWVSLELPPDFHGSFISKRYKWARYLR